MGNFSGKIKIKGLVLVWVRIKIKIIFSQNFFSMKNFRNRNNNLERGRKALLNYRSAFGQKENRNEKPKVSYLPLNMHDLYSMTCSILVCFIFGTVGRLPRSISRALLVNINPSRDSFRIILTCLDSSKTRPTNP